MKVKKFVNGSIQANCYLFLDEEKHEAMIVDPGSERGKLLQWLKDEAAGYKMKYIVDTHGHFDHITANSVCDVFQAPLCIHKLDEPFLSDEKLSLLGIGGDMGMFKEADIILHDGDTLKCGSYVFHVIHTPGHTPGGICLYSAKAKIVFTGDSLFYESIGNTDFPGGSMEDLVNSLQTNILTLPDDTVVYPGHGKETTIGHEKYNNAYVKYVKQKVALLQFDDLEAVEKELEAINVSHTGIKLMAEKAIFYNLKIADVPVKCANILKQTMLSKGGDVAVSKHAADQSVAVTDIIMMGTRHQFREALRTIAIQPWELKGIAEDIKKVLHLD